ncbi:MAG: TerC family protein [Planctomycetota bacterium]|nr:MAG: TerC family protein [Planctomycetota bacterium]
MVQDALPPADVILPISETLSWGIFLGYVFALLALDLFVFHRGAKVIPVGSALRWSAFWISLGLLFGGFVWVTQGSKLGGEYFGCYVMEESLSVDNLFVFLAIFGFFRVPQEYQHKVLFWGILGAMVLRAVFIFAGIEIVQRFSWTFYLFGGVLVYTGFKLLRAGENEIEPEKIWIVRVARKFFAVSDRMDGDKFFTLVNGKRIATPLILVLFAVESSDVVFAVDSVPAAIGISTNEYVVYSSNIMAILGLRSIYFALAAVAELFHYLKYGLACVLVYIGGKMIVHEAFHWNVNAWVNLSIVLGVLALSVIASLMFPKKPSAAKH